MEPPTKVNIPKFLNGNNSLSCTYHRDSDVPCQYGFFFPRDPTAQKQDTRRMQLYKHVTLKTEFSKVKPYWLYNSSISPQDILQYQHINSAQLLEGRDKLILWMNSNCEIQFRDKYSQKLIQNGLNIDVFGGCTRKDPCNKDANCLDVMYRKYKFYLAFENSMCMDYITEKVWKSLLSGMVPIVYGASLEDYERYLPPNSFIYVENFSSPKELVKYIKMLEADVTKYLQYHEWRKTYFVLGNPYKMDSHFHFIYRCTLCRSLFEYKHKQSSILTKSTWWTVESMCKK